MRAPKGKDAEELEGLDDAELAGLARDRHSAAFRLIIQRNNRRLYRIARSVVGNDGEAEDVVQATYVRAFAALGQFRGQASLATWLSRIALNEALGRVRRGRPMVGLDVLDAEASRGGSTMMEPERANAGGDPERTAARGQIRQLIERAVDELPESFRAVFVMRDVEELSTEETADLLGVPPATVKTRLHRARHQLRRTLDAELASTLTEAFPFDGARCARIAEQVLARLGLEPAAASAGEARHG